MGEYKAIKAAQKELGGALACSFKKSGEMLIYVSADANNDEVMESLIRLSTDIYKYRNQKENSDE